MSVANGLSRHPYYPRWFSMNERCYNPEHKSYSQFGGSGIGVCEEWRAIHPHGCKTFIAWLTAEVEQKKHLLKSTPQGALLFEVGRLELYHHYAPANCEVRPPGLHSQKRRHVELTVEKVAELRRRKRANPTLSLAVMETETGLSQATLSRMLRGVLWACANTLEPPIQTLGQGRCGVALV